MTDLLDPMFSCSVDACRIEVSYPVYMLRMFEGEAICQGCYEEYASSEHVPWGHLAPFVPRFITRIEQLEAALSAVEGMDTDYRLGPDENLERARSLANRALQEIDNA